jgi:hypothetical protein
MLFPKIDNPVSCKIRNVNCFLHARNMSVAEIHRELCAVYDQNIMNEGTVGEGCRMFKNERTNVHNEQRSSRLCVMNDDLVQRVDQNIFERRRFTISELLRELPILSLTAL